MSLWWHSVKLISKSCTEISLPQLQHIHLTRTVKKRTLKNIRFYKGSTIYNITLIWTIFDPFSKVEPESSTWCIEVWRHFWRWAQWPVSFVVLADLHCLLRVSHLLHHLKHLPGLDLHRVPHVAGTAPVTLRPDHHDIHRLPLLGLPHHVYQIVRRIRTHDTQDGVHGHLFPHPGSFLKVLYWKFATILNST